MKIRRENWMPRPLFQRNVAGFYSDQLTDAQTSEVSDIGGNTSYLSRCIGTIISLGKKIQFPACLLPLSLTLEQRVDDWLHS